MFINMIGKREQSLYGLDQPGNELYPFHKDNFLPEALISKTTSGITLSFGTSKATHNLTRLAIKDMLWLFNCTDRLLMLKGPDPDTTSL